jgi:hypothetical protein
MARIGVDSSTASAQRGDRRLRRHYFVWMALLGAVIAAIGFVPEYLKFAAGTFPIAWVLNLHSALMVAWLALLLAQALLASTGRLALHEKLGTLGITLGFLVWASMVFVEFRGKIVYPLDPDLSPEYDFDLRGIYIWATFLIFFLGAVYQRRRSPAWHKRFMVFAAFMVLQPAEMRIGWLPRFSFHFLADMLYLDVCLLVPLLAYDYASARRMHPATIVASSVLLGSQGALLLVWGSPAWRHLAYGFTVALRSFF